MHLDPLPVIAAMPSHAAEQQSGDMDVQVLDGVPAG